MRKPARPFLPNGDWSKSDVGLNGVSVVLEEKSGSVAFSTSSAESHGAGVCVFHDALRNPSTSMRPIVRGSGAKRTESSPVVSLNVALFLARGQDKAVFYTGEGDVEFSAQFGLVLGFVHLCGERP